MPMTNYGLAKLTEEMGECLQVVGKMNQFPALMMDDTLHHPDGTQLRRRLEEEVADVLAAARFVCIKMNLDIAVVWSRQIAKEELFNKWDRGEDKEPS